MVGLLVGAGLFWYLSTEPASEYVSLGPANTGHESLACATCHNDARGNLWQQLQSNASYAFGARESAVAFGTEDVTVDNCLQCHDRPNDRHPTYRFTEPRFAEAVQNIDARTCITCHSEHHGERVTLAKVDYCINCHTDLDVEDDPVDISHTTLAANGDWSTCIQCHDFHGNHKYAVAEQMKDTIPYSKINTYLEGGEDPYGDDKEVRSAR